jgi:hypothetical protein
MIGLKRREEKRGILTNKFGSVESYDEHYSLDSNKGDNDV